MSSIYKLSIQGIRSFDANDRETIEFGIPLTLIVGMNGSGKTTIIECLKYATTGDLPPNSKNGAFIHDPKITGETDIRAQVKLAFTSAGGVNMIVTRNIQLLAKRSTNTFKTLEGQLVAINKGERTTLTTRATELDQQIPLYLGVPKAILDYVIFCHQEDNLWPLSEPSNLKKRFDQIFQALKFTKALDSLKTIKKDMGVDIKLLKQSVEHLKTNRDKSRATKLNIEHLKDQIRAYEDQMVYIESELKEITHQSDELFRSNQTFQKVLSRSEQLGHLYSSIHEQIRRLEESIDPLNISKPELEKLLENFSHTLNEKEGLIVRLEAKCDSKRRKLSELRINHNSLILTQGELKAKNLAYKSNIVKRNELMETLRAQHHLVSFDHDQLTNLLEKSKLKLEAMRTDHEHQQSDLFEKVSELKNNVNKHEQHLAYIKDDKTKLSEQIDTLKKKVQEINCTKEDLVQETEDLKKLQLEVEARKTGLEVERINAEIQFKNDKMIQLENELNIIQENITKNNQQSEFFAKFSILKNSFKEKQIQLTQLRNKFENDEKCILWGLKVQENFDAEFKRHYINLQKEIVLSNKHFNEINKTYMSDEISVRNIEKELNSFYKSIQDLNVKIKENLPEDCPIREYNDILAETEESYKIALENLKMHRTTLEFNLKALQILEVNNCCYLCQRKFNTDSESSTLLRDLKSRTNPKFEITLQETVDNEKEYLDSLRLVGNDISLLNDINTRVENLIIEQNNANNAIIISKNELEKAQRKLDSLKLDQDYTEKILRPIFNDILRLTTESSSIEKDILKINSELSNYGVLSTEIQTTEELQEKQKEINDTLRQLRNDVLNLQKDKELKSEGFNHIINQTREKTFKINTIEKQLKEKSNIELELSAQNKNFFNLDSCESEIVSLLPNLKEELENLSFKFSVMKSEHSKQEIEFNEKLSSLKKSVDQLSLINDQISEFEKVESIELNRCAVSLEQSQIAIDELTLEIDKVSESITSHKHMLKDSSNEQKNLKLNIDLIDLNSKLLTIQEEINTLDLKNAELERDKYQQESTRLRNLFEKLSSENAGKIGEVKQLQNQVDSLKQQLQVEYKDIDEIYQKEWITLQTKTLVTDDIDSYSKALDNAIMTYHSLKMEDINRIIDELWKKTYSGTDVDTIKIKSDEVSNSTKGKSYNYRVVMYKQDAELDMRGRCSAGQKVLASIIIRLALSETFGINCGVIALDEPTTNLDGENVESLAKSLNNIIQLRRHQKNFQLIVITHDELFLTHMNASAFTDHFYKVKRDDRQKSQIEWVDINKIHG